MFRFLLPAVLGVVFVASLSGGRRRKAKKGTIPSSSERPPLPPPVPRPEDFPPPVEDVDNEWAPFTNLADVQEALGMLGFPVEVTDAWTPETEASVMAFQKYVNKTYNFQLEEDGEPDSDTLDALSQGLEALVEGEYIFPGEFLEGEEQNGGGIPPQAPGLPGKAKEGPAQKTKLAQPPAQQAQLQELSKEQVVTSAFQQWWSELTADQQAELKQRFGDTFTKVVEAYTVFEGSNQLPYVVTERLAALAPAFLADPEENEFAAQLFDQLIAILGEERTEMFYMILVDAASPEEAAWPVDPEETTWSEELYVAPDCSAVVVGGFWPKNRLTPRVMEAAKSITDHDAIMPPEVVLDSLLGEDSPGCVDATYANWGPAMKQWYDHWVGVIAEDLTIYAQHPELLEEG